MSRTWIRSHFPVYLTCDAFQHKVYCPWAGIYSVRKNEKEIVHHLHVFQEKVHKGFWITLITQRPNKIGKLEKNNISAILYARTEWCSLPNLQLYRALTRHLTARTYYSPFSIVDSHVNQDVVLVCPGQANLLLISHLSGKIWSCFQ